MFTVCPLLLRTNSSIIHRQMALYGRKDRERSFVYVVISSLPFGPHCEEDQ